MLEQKFLTSILAKNKNFVRMVAIFFFFAKIRTPQMSNGQPQISVHLCYFYLLFNRPILKI